MLHRVIWLMTVLFCLSVAVVAQEKTPEPPAKETYQEMKEAVKGLVPLLQNSSYTITDADGVSIKHSVVSAMASTCGLAHMEIIESQKSRITTAIAMLFIHIDVERIGVTVQGSTYFVNVPTKDDLEKIGSYFVSVDGVRSNKGLRMKSQLYGFNDAATAESFSSLLIQRVTSCQYWYRQGATTGN